MHEMTVSRVFACFQIEDAKIIFKNCEYNH